MFETMYMVVSMMACIAFVIEGGFLIKHYFTKVER